MPNIQLPISGDEYILSEPWTFRLFRYHINRDLLALINQWPTIQSREVGIGCDEVTFPTGTKIVFSRMQREFRYQRSRTTRRLRAVREEVHFVTFKLPRNQFHNNRHLTFRVLLEDARRIKHEERQQIEC